MLEQVLSELKPSGAVLQGTNGRQSLPEKAGFAALLESSIAPEEGTQPSMQTMPGARAAMLSNFPVEAQTKGIQIAADQAAVSVLPSEIADDASLSALIETKGIQVAGLAEGLPQSGDMKPSDFKGGQDIISFVNSEGKTVSKPLTLPQGELALIPQGEIGGLEKVVASDEVVVSDEAVDIADTTNLSVNTLPHEDGEAQELKEPELKEPALPETSALSATEHELTKPVVVESAASTTRADGDNRGRNLDAPGYAVQSQVRSEQQAQMEHPEHPEHPVHPQHLELPEQAKGLAYGLDSTEGKKPVEESVSLELEKSEGENQVMDLTTAETEVPSEEALPDTLSNVAAQTDDNSLSAEAEVVQAGQASEEPVDESVQSALVQEPSEEHVIGVAADGLDKSSASSVKPEQGASNNTNGSAAGHAQQQAARSHASFEQGSQNQSQQGQGQQGQGTQQQGQQSQGGQSQQQVAQMAQAFVQNVQAARLQNIERQAPLQLSTAGAPVLESPDTEAANNVLNSDRRVQLPQGLQSIGLPVTHQRWGQSLGQRVVYMANNQIQQAQITLNPEKLGPVQIKLHVDRDQQVHVVMTAQHGVTREAMEAAMPRLKEMMDQAGIDLGSVDVNDQREFAQDSGDKDDEGQVAGSAGMVAGTEADASADESDSQTYSTDNLVDYYA